MAAIATMESVIWPPLFKSDSFGDLSDLPQPISVSSDSVTHSNSSNDSDSSVMNDDSHSTSPLPESESMPISDNYFNLASPTTTVLSAISLSSSSSSSSSSLSGDESAVSIGLPMASALLPQRPLASPSSSAVAMATSPASGAAPARVLKAIDRMKATRSRLESQRKYDIRRRGAARASLNDMRAILPAAEAVADAAEQILQDKVSDSNITIEVESDEKENNKAQDSTLSLPVHQLVRKTTKLIRSLTMAKEKLQLRLQDLECEDSEESQRSAKKARLNSTTTVSEQVQALLHVYSEVNRRYQADAGKLRQLLSSRPPGLADPTAALVEYVAMGMDGTILQDIARFPPDSPFAAACNAIVADAKQYGINFHDMFREPRLTQLHAIVHLYRKSFRYHTNGSSIKATDMQPEILLQMVAMSAPLPSSSSSSSSSSSALTAYSSSSASSPLSSSQSSAYEADCIRDSQLLSHPLGAYSLPAASFRHLQEVLSYLVSLSHSDYSALLAALRPLFASSFPSNRPSNDLPAFFELSPNGTRLRLRQAVMDERFSPSYEHLQAFHALYVENKPVVTLKKIGIPTKNGRMLYFDKDLFLIRCPTTGIPITHVSMPRKFYYNE